MSLLFHRKTKKAMGYVWIVLSIVIILSMVVTYTGLSRVATTPSSVPDSAQTPPVSTPTTSPVVLSTTTTPAAQLPVEKLRF